MGQVQNPTKCEKVEDLGKALEDWLEGIGLTEYLEPIVSAGYSSLRFVKAASEEDKNEKAARKALKEENAKDTKEKAAQKAQEVVKDRKKAILPEDSVGETPLGKRKVQCGDDGKQATPEKLIKFSRAFISHEQSRLQFLVRTGFKGPGQNQVFGYKTGTFANNQPLAYKAALEALARLTDKENTI